MSRFRSVLDEVPATRAAIFRLLKERGFLSIPQIADALGVTHEAARKHVTDLQRSGWIDSDCSTSDDVSRNAATAGRPPVQYCLTPAGDHFFPKQYPALVAAMLDAIEAEGGDDALTAALARITDQRVEELEPRVARFALDRKMDALRAIYAEGDPFVEVERRGDDYVLIERNCPYLSAALARPDMCSTTVSTLRRLTGCQIVRVRRFQDGDARCEFHVRTAEASPERKRVRFEKEPPRTA